MKAWGRNLLLALALLATLLLHWLVRVDVRRPNWEFAPDMAHSPRLDAFATTPLLPEGMVLQPPPPGTVARGHRPLPFGPQATEALRAGKELVNPRAGEKELVAGRGAKLWTAFCRPCHGDGGRGDGPVALRGYPPPPSLALEHARQLPDGQIFHIITFGQGNMPGYAHEIQEEDRWLLVSYVRLLQGLTPRP
jgi:mono/diheme cytochrome c family protein